MPEATVSPVAALPTTEPLFFVTDVPNVIVDAPAWDDVAPVVTVVVAADTGNQSATRAAARAESKDLWSCMRILKK